MKLKEETHCSFSFLQKIKVFQDSLNHAAVIALLHLRVLLKVTWGLLVLLQKRLTIHSFIIVRLKMKLKVSASEQQ